MADSSSISNSKKISKVVGAIVFVCLLAGLFVFLSNRYEYAAAQNKINEWNQQRFDHFYALPENSLDLVFIGSSHSYCTFDPELIDAALGTNSYQMGMPLQFPDASYYTLREVLEHQQPRTVVMELYWGVMGADFNMKQADELFQVMNNDVLKADYYKNVFPVGAKVMYQLPFIRYQQDFLGYENKQFTDMLESELGVYKTAEAQTGVEYCTDKGFIHCNYTMTPGEYGATNQFNRFDGQNWSFSDKQKEYLQKTAELCAQSGAQLLFVTAPVANTSMEKIQNYDSIHDAVAEFAGSVEVPYLDLNMANIDEQLFTDADFRDDAHLNYNGAVIACDYMARWIEQVQDK